MLSGHKRCSHVTSICCNGVNPGLLGMNKVISEDALRRALTAISETEGVSWLEGRLKESVAPFNSVRMYGTGINMMIALRRSDGE